MTYRRTDLVPATSLPQEGRGAVGGRFCRGCGGIYSRFAARHSGKPMYGMDHVSSPCSHEGKRFSPGADWWEAAVEMLPVAAVEIENG